jgi:hypothetical protein
LTTFQQLPFSRRQDNPKMRRSFLVARQMKECVSAHQAMRVCTSGNACLHIRQSSEKEVKKLNLY